MEQRSLGISLSVSLFVIFVLNCKLALIKIILRTSQIEDHIAFK